MLSRASSAGLPIIDSMNLLVRADASMAIGTGHIMRCLALAQAWQDAGGIAIFAAAEITAATRKRLADEKCEVVHLSSAPGGAQDAEQTLGLAREHNAAWIVVDGYQFGGEYQRTIKDAGSKLLFLDDYGHSEHYYADLVLNQSLNVDASVYAAREPNTRLLLGTQYCLLRREFAKWREWKREIPPAARKVLVTMGGSDPDNVTARALEALHLAAIDGTEAAVIVGGSNPHFSELQRMAGDCPFPIEFHRNALNIAELMAWADLAISAAGSTCWELALLGLPSVLLDLAENQTLVAEKLHQQKCAIHAGSSGVAVERLGDVLRSVAGSQQLRETLSQQSRRLADGEGARRVVRAIRDKVHLRLRPVVREDCELLWRWANDPQVRAASFSPDPIAWDSHVSWFESRIRQPDTEIYIAEDEDGESVGQIRFDQRADGDWEADVSITHAMRGRGLAADLIGLGIDFLRRREPRARIHAFVKPSNPASVKAFERLGFMRNGMQIVRGRECIHFVGES